jgi:hypothetical protein
MIKAQHKKWADQLFKFYILRLMRKHFYSFHVLGNLPSIAERTPILLLPNHSTWWDGFFIYLLNLKVFRRPLYLMMLEEQLTKYSFFSKVGAYSIQLDNPKSVLQSMKYTLDILNQDSQPAPLVCIFPQGEMFPPSLGPIKVKTGFQWILKHTERDLTVVPVGMRIEYLDQQLPEVFFQFVSEPDIGPKKIDSDTLELHLTSVLGKMLEQISTGEKGDVILQGKRSVSQKWDQFKANLRRFEK